MDEPLAVALKFGFLAVLYLFLLWVVRSSMRDLARYGGGGAAEPVETPSPSRRARRVAERRDGDGAAGGAPRLRVVAAMGHEPGTTFDVADGAMFGRSDGADIRVDDQFASSSHARIFNRGGAMYIEDMGSTNGTYLNGHKLQTAEPLDRGDAIRIGDSEYRYEE
jgi:FHA domain